MNELIIMTDRLEFNSKLILYDNVVGYKAYYGPNWFMMPNWFCFLYKTPCLEILLKDNHTLLISGKPTNEIEEIEMKLHSMGLRKLLYSKIDCIFMSLFGIVFILGMISGQFLNFQYFEFLILLGFVVPFLHVITCLMLRIK